MHFGQRLAFRELLFVIWQWKIIDNHYTLTNKLAQLMSPRLITTKPISYHTVRL
ncbi:hypothetical protein L686_22755 [Stutzerimonas stutzeri MF28]|nr:hypothetical protein L686_22755 [Stutzerimonas stutzeri MF28]